MNARGVERVRRAVAMLAGHGERAGDRESVFLEGGRKRDAARDIRRRRNGDGDVLRRQVGGDFPRLRGEIAGVSGEVDRRRMNFTEVTAAQPIIAANKELAIYE